MLLNFSAILTYVLIIMDDLSCVFIHVSQCLTRTRYSGIMSGMNDE